MTITDCDSQKIWKCQQTAAEYTEETEDLNFDSNKFLISKINLLVFQIQTEKEHPNTDSENFQGDGDKGDGVGVTEGVDESLGIEAMVEEVAQPESQKMEM